MTEYKVSVPYILPQDIEFVRKKLQEGQASGRSPVVRDFESEFASYVGAKFARSCCNGTAALHLAVKALGLGPKDEVIVPAFTMMSPVFALLYERVKPKLVDVDKKYWVVTPDSISRAVSKKTKAILIVHLYGNPVAMDEVKEIADKHGLFIIEDCAEALGSTYKGKKVGTFGDVSCFSFFANKLITCGEGGMVCTSNDEIADKVSQYRDLCFGKKNKFLHEAIGFNYRMSALQAALGLSQLNRIDEHLQKIRKIAGWYRRNLEGNDILELHTEPPNSEGSYWMYSVIIKGKEGRRDVVTRQLTDAGIETRPFFVPVHLQPACKGLFRNQRYPVSEYLSARGINLPSGLTLNESQVEFVCSTLTRALKKLNI